MKISVKLLLLLAPVTVMATQTIPEDKVFIGFETKLGVVPFNHQLHTDRAESCQTCHHTSTGEEPIKACHDCHTHKGGNDAPKVQDAIHLRCQGCHEENLKAGNPHGPVKKECKLCHIKPAKK